MEQTRGASLAKAIKGVIDRVVPILGFKVKIHEIKGGSSVQQELMDGVQVCKSGLQSMQRNPQKKTQDCMA